MAENSFASASGAAIKAVTGPSHADHARSTSGGISVTPASTIRLRSVGICSPSDNWRLRLL